MQPNVLPPVPVVSPIEANQMMVNGEAVMIDVRESNEWAEARIPEAEFKPMSTISDWYEELPLDTTIIVQCRTGNRSHQVVHALMNQAGMDNVVNLAGGIVAWAQDELPVDSSPLAGL